MIYELGIFTAKINTVAHVAAGIDSFVKEPEAKGALLGAWISEFGELNQVTTLRQFDTMASFTEERERAITASNPFHCGAHLVDFSLAAHEIFPFLKPVKLGKFGPIYEIRTYNLLPNGKIPLIESWAAAVPARIKVSPLIIAMTSLDGAPRFTHIWAYASLEQRAAIRSDAVKTGIWPPKGVPSQILSMKSTVALPTGYSPLG